MTEKNVASVIFAAGKGTRMTGYEGNKTLLPLVPGDSLYEGCRPILLEVLDNLPPGPKGIVVNHRADDVKAALKGFQVSFLDQPCTNGTGGALLAASPFLSSAREQSVIITMGDVPLIEAPTYRRLIGGLSEHDFMVLAFVPQDKAQYGMLEMDGNRVLRIVEWKYWHNLPPREQARLRYCNAGVYAARRSVLVRYLEPLAKKAHQVRKKQGNEWITVEEYFLTDLVELMRSDNLSIGVEEAPEEEVSGVDAPEALRRVQARYAARAALKSGAP